MLKKIVFSALLISALSAFATAQTTDITTTKTTPTKTTKPAPTVTVAAATQTNDPNVKAVRAAFDKLVKGIEASDLEAVTSVYQNSPNTLYFNNNGSITKGWEQDRQNRAARYPKTTNVKLDARDVRVEMLGATGAVVTCLWSQSQEFDGKAESAAGRMTLVFKKIGANWKVVHLHTSPGTPDAARPVMPSERTPVSN